MLKEELKNKALSMIQLSTNFQPFIEEYFEGENGVGEAMFSWANEELDEEITIQLDFTGNLTSLSIDKNDKSHDMPVLTLEERRKRAEQFLLSHYPDALNDLTFTGKKEHTDAIRFNFEQIVIGLPLGRAGCLIDVDLVGNIVEFTYEGVKRIPEIPKTLISKEKLMEDVLSGLDFQLTITSLYMALHHVEGDGLRLVYEPIQAFMTYKADALEPTLTIEHEEDEPETYVSLTARSTTTLHEDLTIEEIIGIPKRMEVIRQVDMGEETGIVWRDSDWEMKEKDLSVDGFFMRQSADTVKAFISKETGKVRSFMWFNERKGDLQLNREACYEKVIDFLQMVFPEYDQYLQLIVQESEDEEEDVKERFAFHMHNGHGVPMHLESVLVVVNCTTGQVDHYSGPRLDIEQLNQVPTKPALTKKDVRALFMNHLDFDLAWKKDIDSEADIYHLAYEACDRYTKTSIRYVDAVTGEVITDREY